jgi:hypothetical protein
MNWSDLPLAPSSRTLRQFAALWIVFFTGLAYGRGSFLSNRPLAYGLAGLAIAIGLAGLARPRLIRPIFVVWMIVAFPIGWIVSRLLLACLFYGVFLPVGLCFRLFGRDLLNRRYDPNKETYWTRKPYATDLAGYFRQF